METVQGMSVVKSFNLTGKGDKKLQNAFEYNRRTNVEVTNILTPYTALQEAILQIAGVGIFCCRAALDKRRHKPCKRSYGACNVFPRFQPDKGFRYGRFNAEYGGCRY